MLCDWRQPVVLLAAQCRESYPSSSLSLHTEGQEVQTAWVPLLPPNRPIFRGSRASTVQLQSSQLHPSRGQQWPCLALPESSQFPAEMRKTHGSSPCSHLEDSGGGLFGSGNASEHPENTSKLLLQSWLWLLL